MMRSAIFPAAVVLMLTAAPSARAFFEPHDFSCASWVIDHQEQNEEAQYQDFWVTGYLAGISQEAIKQLEFDGVSVDPKDSKFAKELIPELNHYAAVDEKNEVDVNVIYLWITNYCNKNHNKTIMDASEEYYLHKYKKINGEINDTPIGQ